MSSKEIILGRSVMAVSKTKTGHKSRFAKDLKTFVGELSKDASTDDGQWKVKGFIDTLRNIYTISSDTKIISKVLETHLLPRITVFADKINYRIVLADHQNYYPDFSFVHKEDDRIRFAVDLKTTYRLLERPGYVNGFTLGSHGGYFRKRDEKKNIQFPYNTYLGHFCLGIIYTRAELETDAASKVIRVAELQPDKQNKESIKYKIITVDKLNSVVSVIRDLEFFACEKWQLASDKHGSGNTANIGSITNIEDIVNGNGMFVNLGEDWFDEYWTNYGLLTRMVRGKAVKIKSLKDFIEFKGGDVSKINPKKTWSTRKT